MVYFGNILKNNFMMKPKQIIIINLNLWFVFNVFLSPGTSSLIVLYT